MYTAREHKLGESNHLQIISCKNTPNTDIYHAKDDKNALSEIITSVADMQSTLKLSHTSSHLYLFNFRFPLQLPIFACFLLQFEE